MATLELIESVAKELGLTLGRNCSVEYPGFISMRRSATTEWAIGTANGSWGGNIEWDSETGRETDAGFEIDGSETWTDPALIANAIAVEILEDECLTGE